MSAARATQPHTREADEARTVRQHVQLKLLQKPRYSMLSLFTSGCKVTLAQQKPALHFDLPSMQRVTRNALPMLDGSREPKLQVSHSTMKVTDTPARCGNLCL